MIPTYPIRYETLKFTGLSFFESSESNYLEEKYVRQFAGNTTSESGTYYTYQRHSVRQLKQTLYTS